MSDETVLLDRRDAVAILTLNRPDVLNSFNRPMAQRLQRLLDECAGDGDVRAVVLTGAGRAFCAGQDLAEAMPAEGQAPEIEDIVESSYNPVIRAIRGIGKPVVAAVNGVAAGAGANVALACDFVMAARGASFIQAFSRIGLIPDSGGTFFLPRLVGLARAAELTMLADKLPAERALDLGMIYRVVEPDSLLPEALALAADLASRPTVALGLIKRALNASFANDLDTQLDLEKKLQGEAGRTNDYREGVKAFLEKRDPEFKGS
jgi:2-(1,2-epoxy-1,2-dihydrophenyl)acetyl-CoA isomerase